jgi:hypothetical protein
MMMPVVLPDTVMLASPPLSLYGMAGSQKRGQGGVPGGAGAALLIDNHFADFGA